MIPIALTLLRLVLSFILIALLFIDRGPARIAAVTLFLLAGLTDWLDGFLARRLHQTSALGALLDPIADKILVLGILAVLAWQQTIPVWMVGLIAGREVAVTTVRLLALQRQVVLAAAAEGKHKTAMQMLTILLALLERLFGPGAWLGASVQLCLWLTLVLTMLSGAAFFARHQSVIRDLFAHR